MTARYRVITGRVERFTEHYHGPPFHAVFCDPPYGLGDDPDMAQMLLAWLEGQGYDTGGGFMGKAWDVVPGPRIWEGIYDHMLPGANLWAFSGTRTSDLLGVSIRLAGFERRDAIACWLYAQGFPKSHDVSKAIDEAAGAEWEVVGERPIAYPDSETWGTPNKNSDGDFGESLYELGLKGNSRGGKRPVTAPATPEAERFSGYGTALKPAHEDVLCFQKPTDGTFAENALRHGVAGINVDGGRIATGGRDDYGRSAARADGTVNKGNGSFEHGFKNVAEANDYASPAGRWPANVILQHHEDCVQRGVRRVKGTNPQGSRTSARRSDFGMGASGGHDFTDPDGRETVAAWDCHPDCAVRALAEQSGESGTGVYKPRSNNRTVMQFSPKHGWNDHNMDPNNASAPDDYGDVGTAARFFYQAKAHRRERQAGLPEGLENRHPTVKPITLARYLATLILPPPGDEPRRLLIPFGGVCSEAIGAALAGWDEIVVVEMNKEYAEIGRARLAAWMDAAERLQTTDVDAILDHLGALEKAERERQEQLEAGQLPLFGGDV